MGAQCPGDAANFTQGCAVQARNQPHLAAARCPCCALGLFQGGGKKNFWEDQGMWTVPKKRVEKPQDGRQKSSQDIGSPYQMEDNKAALRAAPLGFVLSSIWQGFPMFWLHIRTPFWFDFRQNLPILRIPFPRGLF